MRTSEINSRSWQWLTHVQCRADSETQMWLDSLPVVRNEGIFEGRLVATPESTISLSRSSRSRHHIEGTVTGLDVLCLGLRFEQNQEVYSFLHTASLAKDRQSDSWSKSETRIHGRMFRG